MQAGERELVLGFDPGAAKDGHVPGAVGGVAEQGRLPDPGLAVQHEDGAPPAPGATQQVIQDTLLSLAPQQHEADARPAPGP